MGLEYYDRGHIYMLDGERIPCVSDLCRFLSREIYRDAPQWQLDAAADRGTKVHAATEALDNTGTANIEEEYLPYLKAYVAFRKEHAVEWEFTEQSMWHPEHRYAGTIDRYGTVDGKKTLVDFKTTYTVHKPLCRASLNLYRMMLEARHMQVEQLMILHLKKDGKYRIVQIEIDDSLPIALLTLNTAMAKKKRRKTNE